MQPIKGSERSPLQGARDIGPADPKERLEVMLVLRRKDAAHFEARIKRLRTGDASEGFLSRKDFAERYGADPKDLDLAKAFAAQNGLAVVHADPGRRTVTLSGAVAQFNRAFGVDLRRFDHPSGAYRGRVGQVHLPDELGGVVEAVLGLDNRPQARPHFRVRRAPQTTPHQAAARAASSAPAGSFSPAALAGLYNFPPAGTGKGQCVAIIELGGGYRTGDLAAYFAEEKVSPAPTVVSVSVDQAQNSPTGDPAGPDGEVMLDIEVVGCVAPDAKIAVYFAPNTDAGFLDAVSQAAHDDVNKPSVISISWGGPESAWTAQAMTAFDQALQAAAAMGVTVCVASGDSGSSDGATSGDHVDFPASSPHVLACGGTSLRAADGAISSEVVWNDPGGGATGGGVSTFFALPTWQSGLSVTRTAGGPAPLKKRGVPDVAGDADPETGYQVRVDGQVTVYGGTSAVAPLWAGLLARINEIKGSPVGFINPQLYARRAALREITSGDNGDFAASPGWNACTGLGSPDGGALAAALGAK